MTKLKNCPFCGGEAAFIIGSKINDVTGIGFNLRVQCKKCNLTLPKPALLMIDLNEDGSFRYIKDGRMDLANKWNNRKAVIIEENEVHIPDRITLNPDMIESGILNIETTMDEKRPVLLEYTPFQDYSIQFFDNTEVKKSWTMHMTEEQFKGMAIGMAHMLGLEITGDTENDQV